MFVARARRPVEMTAAVGVVVMLAGTFAPWLASGTSLRNIYRTAGVIQRLAQLGRAAGLVLDALPMVTLYCVLAGALYLLGWHRVAGVAVAVAAITLGLVAGAALAHRGGGMVHIVAAGPAITVIGAGITLLCLLLLALPAPSRRTGHQPALTSTMELT